MPLKAYPVPPNIYFEGDLIRSYIHHKDTRKNRQENWKYLLIYHLSVSGLLLWCWACQPFLPAPSWVPAPAAASSSTNAPSYITATALTSTATSVSAPSSAPPWSSAAAPPTLAASVRRLVASYVAVTCVAA